MLHYATVCITVMNGTTILYTLRVSVTYRVMNATAFVNSHALRLSVYLEGDEWHLVRELSQNTVTVLAIPTVQSYTVPPHGIIVSFLRPFKASTLTFSRTSPYTVFRSSRNSPPSNSSLNLRNRITTHSKVLRQTEKGRTFTHGQSADI